MTAAEWRREATALERAGRRQRRSRPRLRRRATADAGRDAAGARRPSVGSAARASTRRSRPRVPERSVRFVRGSRQRSRGRRDRALPGRVSRSTAVLVRGTGATDESVVMVGARRREHDRQYGRSGAFAAARVVDEGLEAVCAGRHPAAAGQPVADDHAPCPRAGPERASWSGSPTRRRWRLRGSDLQPEIDVLIVNAVEAGLVGPLRSAAVIVTEGASGATLIQDGSARHVPRPRGRRDRHHRCRRRAVRRARGGTGSRHADARGAGACGAGRSAQGDAGGHLVRAAHGGRVAGDPRLTCRRPTIREVATLAGVSIGTVSNVLTSRRGVRPETRAKIDAAIRSSASSRIWRHVR